MWPKKKVLPEFKPYKDPADAENFAYNWRKAEASRHNVCMLGKSHRRSASSSLAQRNRGNHVLSRRQSFNRNETRHSDSFTQANHSMLDRAFKMNFDPHDKPKCNSPSSRRVPFKEVNNNKSSYNAMSLLNHLSIPRKILTDPANKPKPAILELPSIEETEDIWVKNHEREVIYSDSSPTPSVRSLTSDSCASKETDFWKHLLYPCADETFHSSNATEISGTPSSIIFPTTQYENKFYSKENGDVNDHSEKLNFRVVRSPHTPCFVNVKIKESPDFQHNVETVSMKETECSELCEDNIYIPDELSESPWPDCSDNSSKGLSPMIISDDKVRKDKQIQILQPYVTDPDEELTKLMNSI